VENDEEINSFFKEIKRNSKDLEYNDFITYDEFIKGIMDLPFLLEQVSKGIKQSESFTEEGPVKRSLEEFVREFNSESPGITNDQILRYSGDSSDIHFNSNLFNSLSANLRNFVKILNVSLGSDSAPEPEVEVDKIKGAENVSGLLAGIEYVLDSAEDKFKISEDSTEKSSGYKECFGVFVPAVRQFVAIFKEVYKYSDASCTDMKKKIQDLELQLDQQNSKVSMLENTNSKLMAQLRELESESQLTERLNESIQAEKEELMNILHQVKSSEQKAKCEVLDILNSIKSKESEISKLQKEINRLTSLKTLQEMKGTRIAPEAFRKKRIEMMTPRASAPNRLWLNSPIPSSPTPGKLPEDSTSAITEDLFKEKQRYLQKQTAEIRLKQQELARRELELKIYHEEKELKHKEEIQSLHKECQKLLILWKEEQLKNRSLKSYTVESTPAHRNTSGSLFDEFQRIGEQADEGSRSSLSTPRSQTDERSSIKPQAVPIMNQQAPKRRNRCCGFMC
jgi:DNA repair exonuclease SbcCD ATPase subunit